MACQIVDVCDVSQSSARNITQKVDAEIPIKADRVGKCGRKRITTPQTERKIRRITLENRRKPWLVIKKLLNDTECKYRANPQLLICRDGTEMLSTTKKTKTHSCHEGRTSGMGQEAPTLYTGTGARFVSQTSQYRFFKTKLSLFGERRMNEDCIDCTCKASCNRDDMVRHQQERDWKAVYRPRSYTSGSV